MKTLSTTTFGSSGNLASGNDDNVEWHKAHEDNTENNNDNDNGQQQGMMALPSDAQRNEQDSCTDYACVDRSRVVHWNDEDLYVAWNVFDPLRERVSMILITMLDGQLFEYVTLELPVGSAERESFAHNEILLKIYGECEGVLDALLKAGVVSLSNDQSFYEGHKRTCQPDNDDQEPQISKMLARCHVHLEVPTAQHVIKTLDRNRLRRDEKRARNKTSE